MKWGICMEQTFVSVCSLRNNIITDKPNEDFYLFDNERNIYILLDGVTRDCIDGAYPIPSPSLAVSIICARTILSYNLKHSTVINEDLLVDAIREGNKSVQEFNLDKDNFITWYCRNCVFNR